MRPWADGTHLLRPEQSYVVLGKRLFALQDATLRAIGDLSPCACASMVADFGLRAAELPGASREAGGGARALNAAGPAVRARPPPAHLSRALRGRGGRPRASCAAAAVSSAASSPPGPDHAVKEPAAGRHLPAALSMAPRAPTPGSGSARTQALEMPDPVEVGPLARWPGANPQGEKREGGFAILNRSSRWNCGVGIL